VDPTDVPDVEEEVVPDFDLSIEPTLGYVDIFIIESESGKKVGRVRFPEALYAQLFHVHQMPAAQNGQSGLIVP
jgi:hypothetical protein